MQMNASVQFIGRGDKERFPGSMQLSCGDKSENSAEPPGLMLPPHRRLNGELRSRHCRTAGSPIEHPVLCSRSSSWVLLPHAGAGTCAAGAEGRQVLKRRRRGSELTGSFTGTKRYIPRSKKREEGEKWARGKIQVCCTIMQLKFHG